MLFNSRLQEQSTVDKKRARADEFPKGKGCAGAAAQISPGRSSKLASPPSALTGAALGRAVLPVRVGGSAA